jgi:hypothetical protein
MPAAVQLQPRPGGLLFCDAYSIVPFLTVDMRVAARQWRCRRTRVLQCGRCAARQLAAARAARQRLQQHTAA